jgi:hypothetical protein
MMKDHLTARDRRRQHRDRWATLIAISQDPQRHRYWPHPQVPGACEMCGLPERAHRKTWLWRLWRALREAVSE